MAKITEDEREFLLKKYQSQGFSRSESMNRLERTLGMIIISAATIII